jgi:hypothetical protein
VDVTARWLRALAACVAFAAAAAGCSDSDDDDSTPGVGGSAGTSSGGAGTSSRAGTPNGDAGTGGTTNDAGTGGTTNGDAGTTNDAAGAGNALDHVPYANVVAVATSGDDGAYDFSVSVESSDTGCSEYADWWEVLTEDGELGYRRIIDHSHTDANGTSDFDAPGNTFTRGGGPVPVGADSTVIVRAHMSVGGYNGMAMRGSVASGFAQAPEIDAHFAADLETAEPQPTNCTF